ncbi:rhomboid family intramembrane serine protease [Bizionia gelidisalsuginis]|uniref:Rhomboid family intramembrane serine protease n=2 Tax=Bizionia TaxID=283785 RepID=A0A8H2LGC8_9FLAO|nr:MULTISPECIES: rhomboid family intramembrane serine protease [Bizionia]TYB77289.1 rhomboid family intramembrane serine protease [Bizionia saleffrena]TYC18031.1 rhomboid family intramembrane serine protease [Bizionia gelidisalsuginis]
MGNLNSITIMLIAANAIFSYKGFNNYAFFEKFKFDIGAIQRGQKYRMVSSGFLHTNPAHLFMNMFGLFLFADQVIAGVGEIGFLIVYFGSLLAGSLLSLYFNKNDYNYTAVGASGAVTGVLYSAIVLGPELKYYFIFLPSRIGSFDLGIKGYLLGIGYMLYTIYAMKKKTDNVGHDAHFGGAIGGYVFTLLLASSLLTVNLTVTLLLALPIVILFVMKKAGKL